MSNNLQRKQSPDWKNLIIGILPECVCHCGRLSSKWHVTYFPNKHDNAVWWKSQIRLVEKKKSYNVLCLYYSQHANEDVERMLLGNKCDMEDKRVVPKAKGEQVRWCSPPRLYSCLSSGSWMLIGWFVAATLWPHVKFIDLNLEKLLVIKSPAVYHISVPYFHIDNMTTLLQETQNEIAGKQQDSIMFVKYIMWG